MAGATLSRNPGEVTESHAMETLLERTRSTYDLVVIDTPPLTAVSDAFPLLRKVDGVIIVGRVGRNRRDVAERLHEEQVSGRCANLCCAKLGRCRDVVGICGTFGEGAVDALLIRDGQGSDAGVDFLSAVHVPVRLLGCCGEGQRPEG